MNNNIRKVNTPSVSELCHIWDDIALARYNQLISRKDLSFENVLKPVILNLSENLNKSSVLDAGCGSGILTEILALDSKNITGIDMSIINIEIATSRVSMQENISYIHSTIEEYAYKSDKKYSLIIANMVLQDSANLSNCLEAFAKLSLPNANLVITITHPWFWPVYWGYDKEPWFNYIEEQAIEAPFKVSTDDSSIGKTIHFHRPLSSYLSGLKEAGFQLDLILEPFPLPEVQQRYPAIWEFPRFLALRCKYEPIN